MTVYMDTGHGATLTFGTSALTYKWRKITACEQGGEAVESTYLGTVAVAPSTTVYKSFLPGDLIEPGEFEIEYCWGTKTALPTIGTVETITVTFPLGAGHVVAADLEGTGFIMSRTAFPELSYQRAPGREDESRLERGHGRRRGRHSGLDESNHGLTFLTR